MKGFGMCCGEGQDRASVRRRRIIDAARILFVENGFHATGVAQIAQRSGVAVGQIYRDFEAKEDIVAMIVESDCSRFMARETLQRAIAGGDAAAVWDSIGQLIAPDDPSGVAPLFAEIIAESSRNRRIAAIFAAVQAEVRTIILAALAVLAPGDHLIQRRADLADLVLAQSLGLRQHRLLNPDLDTGRLLQMILAMMETELTAMQTAEPAEARGGGVPNRTGRLRNGTLASVGSRG